MSTHRVLLDAAEAAENLAFGALIHSNLRRWAVPDLAHRLIGLRASQVELIVTSGPEHWLVLAESIRQLVDLHQTETRTETGIPVFDEFDDDTAIYRRCVCCHHRYYPVDGLRERDGCPTLRALLPLAEQLASSLTESHQE